MVMRRRIDTGMLGNLEQVHNTYLIVTNAILEEERELLELCDLMSLRTNW